MERNNYDRGTSEYNKRNHPVNVQSAKIGEKAADKAINAIYPGYQLIHPDELDSSGSIKGNFDMVYQNADGDVIIVEAKGGSSTLGKKDIGDRSYQQGTTKYAAAITEQMAGSKHASDRKAALAIRTAVQDGNQIQYLHAETPITKTLSGSTVSEVRLSEFDVDIKKLAG